MSFTQNDWGQREIINIIKIPTKWGTYTIHAIIPTKYHKYPSATILKYANDLAKVNKSPYVHLKNMTPHDACSIKMYVRPVSLADIIHNKKE